MPAEVPPVLVLLIERSGPPAPRQATAWREALAAYPGGGEIAYVWAGGEAVPAGMDYASPGAAASVLGLPVESMAVVAESSAVPGPHLLQRLLEEATAAPDRVVDARLLPVELTRVTDRQRGYHLVDGTDPSAALLREARYAGSDEDEGDEDEDDEDGEAVTATGVTAASPSAGESPATNGAGVSDHDLQARDGAVLHARVTGVCCAVRTGHLRALDDALMAAPSAASGEGLLTAAGAHHLDVVVAETAAVSLPVHLDWEARVDGLVPVTVERSVEWSPSLHPAELPSSALGAMARQFNLRPVAPRAAGLAADAPFLSIVTRTQGRRLHCLEDLFTCLAGQSDRDFELLLMCHRTSAEEVAGVRDVVAAIPGWLRARVRLIEVARPGRAAPLNDGVDAARGRYVVALDDDDTVLAHYVATFKAGAVEHDGQLLRTVAVRQDVAPVGGIDTLCAVSVDDPFREWPLDFSLVDHLVSNYSPFMTVAFPHGAFHALGLRFDEALDTTEDWDLVVRSAAVLGVASLREITSVYRWWVHTGSSREVHTKAEWAAARVRVQQALDESVLLMQSDETRRLLASLKQARRDSDASHRLARRLATSQHQVILQMDELKAAHDRAVESTHEWRTRAKAATEKVKEVRDRLRTRHDVHLALLREADMLLADRPHSRPDQSIVDLSAEDLRALIERLRDEPSKRSLLRRRPH